MGLKSDAKELAIAIEQVLRYVKAYAQKNCDAYIGKLAHSLTPLVEQYEQAVLMDRDRDRAADILTDIHPIIEAINAASTKGEMRILPIRGIFAPDPLNTYWKLYAIFRETKYRDDTL